MNLPLRLNDYAEKPATPRLVSKVRVQSLVIGADPSVPLRVKRGEKDLLYRGLASTEQLAQLEVVPGEHPLCDFLGYCAQRQLGRGRARRHGLGVPERKRGRFRGV